MDTYVVSVSSVLVVLIVFFLMATIQHNRRHEHAYMVNGVDMRGIEEVKGFKARILWLRGRPDLKKKDPYKILLAWEQRESALDKVNS